MPQSLANGFVGATDQKNFYEQLNLVLSASETSGEQHVFMYLRLDRYRFIHTHYSRLSGGELARQLYELIARSVPTPLVLAHLQKSEFGLLFKHCALREATAIAERLPPMIGTARFRYNGHELQLSACIGLLMMDARDRWTVASAVDAAASSCHEALHAERGFKVYRNQTDMSVDHQAMQWVSDVQQAIEEDRLALEFQRIKNTLDDRSDGLFIELLLRLRDEQGNKILPSVFLPAVDRYNLSAQLDRWVVAIALEWLSRHDSELDKIALCSINLSGSALADEAFARFLVRRLESSQNLARKICFEINEAVVLGNLPRARRFVRQFRDLGCRFALDGFGLGWSSFAELRGIPVSFLKIDGTLITGVIDDKVDYALVKAISDVGHAMGKRIVATCVENENAVTLLQELGIDYLQGNYIDRPKPLSELSLPEDAGAGFRQRY